MSPKVSLPLLLFGALAKLGRGAGLCPQLDSIGHAASQPWVFSNLNWTLTQVSSGQTWPPPDTDFDESHVSFDIKSAFNNASVSCSAQGKEFSEEYTRQLAGLKPPTYNWYTCQGPSKTVKTEFRMVWWNDHTVEIRQTWTCPTSRGPMRATGKTSILGQFDCRFDAETDSRREQCLSRAGASLPFDATIVKVLPPPKRRCAAASEATPNWNVLDFKWVTRKSTFYYDFGTANITFRLINEALNYSPRMTCTEPSLHGPQGGVYITPYACGVFEANEEDVPPTSFDWVLDDKSLLRINQTWYCDDGASRGERFQSIGDRDIKSLLDCTSESHPINYGGTDFNETITTCVAKSDFEITGKLQ
ncbi:hypothetical protein HD806DRAFT_371872 [Xylariaceae sp. AK1471]|nr:hypothetical protein HD806DRAFT_371872 [Xylariaceae sp. AK1471]